MEKYTATIDFYIEHDSVKMPDASEFESRKGQMAVDYHIDIEARDYGIKSIILMAMEQKKQVELEVIPAGKEDPEYVSMEINLQNIEIENPSHFGSISPKEIEITLTEIVKEGDNYKAQAKGLLKF